LLTRSEYFYVNLCFQIFFVCLFEQRSSLSEFLSLEFDIAIVLHRLYYLELLVWIFVWLKDSGNRLSSVFNSDQIKFLCTALPLSWPLVISTALPSMNNYKTLHDQSIILHSLLICALKYVLVYSSRGHSCPSFCLGLASACVLQHLYYLDLLAWVLFV
jgi:hypothetical protein